MRSAVRAPQEFEVVPSMHCTPHTPLPSPPSHIARILDDPDVSFLRGLRSPG
jgi:hypothetical protein